MGGVTEKVLVHVGLQDDGDATVGVHVGAEAELVEVMDALGVRVRKLLDQA